MNKTREDLLSRKRMLESQLQEVDALLEHREEIPEISEVGQAVLENFKKKNEAERIYKENLNNG